MNALCLVGLCSLVGGVVVVHGLMQILFLLLAMEVVGKMA